MALSDRSAEHNKDSLKSRNHDRSARESILQLSSLYNIDRQLSLQQRDFFNIVRTSNLDLQPSRTRRSTILYPSAVERSDSTQVGTLGKKP
ncbi:hypothetical protein POG22_22715 [Geitlerinema sp. CS-897]|nr:hypothetical protein [Geitlerinema sp. CS-897]